MRHQTVLSDEERTKRLLQVKEWLDLQEFNQRKSKIMKEAGLDGRSTETSKC
jgi:hypothetical protein